MLSSDTLNRLKYALASPGAATEVDQFLGGQVIAGHVYWVDSTDATAKDAATVPGDFNQPFATLAYAISRCTASKGDVIYLKPGHAETTTAITWDKAGIKVVGIGYGRNRPAFTATTGATNLINVTAANNQLWNVRLIGAASGVTALLDTSTAGDDFEMHGCALNAAATPLKLLTLGGQRPIIDSLRVTQSANGLDNVVAFTAGVDGFIFRDWDVICSSGIDNSVIDSGAFAHVGYIIDALRVVGVDTLIVNFASSTGAKADGYMRDSDFIYSGAVTSIEDGVAAATSKGVGFGFGIRASDVTGKRAGGIPLATAS